MEYSGRESVCETPYDNWIVEASISQDMGEIIVETLAKIVDNFPKRLKACIEANGGHFK